MVDIRENLKAIINDSGYKQAIIAEKANLTPAMLSGVLNKARKLDANELFVLCDVLNISPEQLRHYRSITSQ